MANKEKETDLMEIEQFGLSFRFPERIGVENALRYWSMLGKSFQSDNRLLEIWEAALKCDMLQDWKCERFPDPNVPLADVPADDEMFVAQLIISVSNRIQAFMTATRSVEKN